MTYKLKQYLQKKKDETDNPKKKQKNCTYCKSDNLYVLEGFLCCKSCGAYLEKYLVESAEWRYYGSEDTKSQNPNRCGMPTNRLLPQSSLGTIITNNWQNGYNRNWYKIRRYHQWQAMPYKERSLYKVFTDIEQKSIIRWNSKGYYQ